MNPAITTNGAVPSDVPLSVFSGDGPVYAHRKPHPQHAYELMMTLEHAPGPFQVVQADISLHASSNACAIYHPVAGTAIAPDALVPITLERISDTQYRGVFHTDPLQNESYWEGKPVCEWVFGSVSVYLRATGADGETGFNHSIDAAELAKGLPVKSYFWKGYYPKVSDLGSLQAFSTHGNQSLEQIRPEYRGNLFTITLTAHKVQPRAFLQRSMQNWRIMSTSLCRQAFEHRARKMRFPSVASPTKFWST